MSSKKSRWNQRFLRYFKESKNSDLRGCHPYKRVSLPKNRYFLLQRWGKMDVIKRKQNQMKFYINNKELSEKVFWRTLESLVSPIQRVHILDGMKVKIADYLCWIEIV